MQFKNCLNKELENHPFFYKDGFIVSFHQIDEKNNLIHESEKKSSSKDSKWRRQKYSNSRYSVAYDVNQRIITQLEDENLELFQITKSQKKKIKQLGEKLNKFSGGRSFC